MTQLGLRALLTSALSVLILRALIVPLHFGTMLLIARTLGVEGVGVYTMATLLSMMFVRIGELGVPAANVYYLARNDYPVGQIARANLRLAGGIGAAGLVMLLAFTRLTHTQIFGDFPLPLLLVASVAVPFSLLHTYCSSLFHGLQDFRVYNLLVAFPHVLMFFGTCVVATLCPQETALVFMFVCSQALPASVSLWCLRKHLGARVPLTRDPYIRRCLGYGWKAHISVILAFLNYRLDMLLVGSLLGSAAVGLYGVAVCVAEGVWLVSQAFSTVVFPKSAELKNNEALRTQLTSIISRWVLLVSAMGAIVLACACSWLLPLVFGEAFSRSVAAFRFLLPGIVIGSMSRVLSNDLAARGYPQINMYIGFVALVTNVVGNCLLIPAFGIEGAAIATSISYGLNAVGKVLAYSHFASVRWYVPLAPTRADLARLVAFARGLA